MEFLCRFGIFFLLFLSFSTEAKRRYDGYRVLRVTLTTREHKELMKTLEDDAQVDIWSEGFNFVDVMVSPENLMRLVDLLAYHQVAFVVQTPDVQRDINEEEKRLAKPRDIPVQYLDYDIFNTYSDIVAELDAAVARCPTSLGVNCETFVIGNSFEGRELKGLRIFRTDTTQTAVWIDATIHAREWLSTATHLKILSHLIDDYATDAQVQGLVDKHEFHLLPIVNPDGYDYTWTTERLWRKSRSPNAGSACIGTDLNRNFDHKWGNAGTSTEPCSDTYGGSGPASEPETQAVQARITTLGPNLIATIHLHTYSQFWLIPWGDVTGTGACNIAVDHDEMMVVANAAADATQNTHGTVWERGNWCQVLYPASGNNADFSKGVAGVKYTFTPELRGNSFIVAADQIQPSFEEVWNGVVAAITTIDP